MKGARLEVKGARLELMYAVVAGRLPTAAWGWLPVVMFVLADFTLGKSTLKVNGKSRIYVMN